MHDAALERMNVAPTVTTRADGYVQDQSSQWVAAAVEASPGERVFDVCAAPGGKATAMAAGGRSRDRRRPASHRAGLVAANVARLDARCGDGRRRRHDAAVRRRCVRRRADRRAVQRPRRAAPAARRPLADQAERRRASWPRSSGGCWTAARRSCDPGGRLVYSVCTLTAAESIDHPTPGRVRGRRSPSRRSGSGARSATAGGCCRRMPTPTAWSSIRYRRSA